MTDKDPIPQVEGETQKRENPLLKRMNKIPGQHFRLPSLGLFYKNNELSPEVAEGEVEVLPMTTLDEVIMKSPDLLFTGEAIERVFKRCIPSVLEPKKLLAKDVDFLLICLRKVTYGNIVEVETKCQHCVELALAKATTEEDLAKIDIKAQNYSISLDYFIKNTKNMDIESTKNYMVSLSNGQSVELKPVTFEDFVGFSQNNDDALTPEESANRINESFAMLIDNVDRVRDRSMIMEWLAVLPLELKGELEQHIVEVTSFGTDTVYKTKCKDCKQDLEIRTVLNPLYFFTLPSSQKKSKK
jgi:hypothetical protein